MPTDAMVIEIQIARRDMGVISYAKEQPMMRFFDAICGGPLG
jgi:hypothetical protein